MRLEIDLWAWPFIPLEERGRLPMAGGVYAAVCDGRVLYVGQSSNIRVRWKAHEKLEALAPYPSVRLGWIGIDAPDERNAIEALLWERHDPPLNRVRPCPTGARTDVCHIRIALADVLREKGKSLYWLNKQTGVRYATLHRIATKPVGKIDLEILEKVCKALGVGVDELLRMD